VADVARDDVGRAAAAKPTNILTGPLGQLCAEASLPTASTTSPPLSPPSSVSSASLPLFPHRVCDLRLVGCLPAPSGHIAGHSKSGKRDEVVTFVKESSQERLGLLAGDSVIDLALAAGVDSVFLPMLTFIRSRRQGLIAAKSILANPPEAAVTPLKDVTLVAPIRPTTILCSGSNYRDHNAEKANTPISGKEPEFFVKTAGLRGRPERADRVDERFSKKIDCETSSPS